MSGKFRFLGTGSSLGVPVIGCKCSTCLSGDPRNKRSRSGSLLQVRGKTFLIDASPDYRQQALREGITAIDGFILTHSHYDHIGGFDDLKVYGRHGKKLPCLLLESTFQELKTNYPYFITPTKEDPNNCCFFSWHRIKEPFGSVVFEGVPLEYVTFRQSRMEVLGLRFENLVYISDIKEYDENLLKRLSGVDTLIVSALRKERSPIHFSLEEACEFSRLIEAKRTYLVHIAHELEHSSLLEELPSNITPAYDGLEIAF